MQSPLRFLQSAGEESSEEMSIDFKTLGADSFSKQQQKMLPS